MFRIDFKKRIIVSCRNNDGARTGQTLPLAWRRYALTGDRETMLDKPAPARSGHAALAGKVAVVTGGTQGLGEAIARAFAERGAAGLVICGRNAKNGERVASEIGRSGCPTVFVQADLAKVADCRKVVAKADKRFGRVDVLVNAAGADRPRQHLRHHGGALQRDLRRQRPRAVLPDPGERCRSCGARRSRARSSTSSRCRRMAASPSSPPIAPRRARSPR